MALDLARLGLLEYYNFCILRPLSHFNSKIVTFCMSSYLSACSASFARSTIPVKSLFSSMIPSRTPNQEFAALTSSVAMTTSRETTVAMTTVLRTGSGVALRCVSLRRVTAPEGEKVVITHGRKGCERRTTRLGRASCL